MSELGILPNPVPFGKYYLLERVNIGGMAEIFKAKAFGVEGFERLLAVKKILASIAEDESFINMFIDEAKIAGQLNHPNIAQIFDLGKVDDSYFIALEYISGKDLKTIFERGRRIGEKVSIPRVCYTIMKVCDGLGHAHHKKDAQGRDLDIVHRDVSPQNILLSYSGEVKIIDFGIAKAQGKTSETQIGILKGKFSYMSPEQVRGLHVDRRSDLFSLGIVLYELLTLERLFLGDSDFDTLEKIRKVEMSPPSLYNPHIPKELEDIVLRALAKSPEDRFQDTHEFADALEQFMRNQGYYYTNKDLASYMKESFGADIEFEDKKVEYYKSLNLQPPEILPALPNQKKRSSGGGGGLSWGEDELVTQIYDRHDEMIEEIGDSDIVYADGSGGVQGISISQDAHPGHGGDPPTVEYTRDLVQRGLHGVDFDDESPRSGRKPRPTASMTAIEARHHHTIPGTVTTHAPTTSRPPRSPALILGVSLSFIAISLVLLYLFWPWPAQLNFQTTPASVVITIDEVQVFDGTTPYLYKLEPGIHTVSLSREGFEPLTLQQEFQKSTTYNIEKTLTKLAPSPDTPAPALSLTTVPPEATVEIDGKTLSGGPTKTLEAIAPGPYKAVITHPGYIPKETTLELGTPGGLTTQVTLEPKTYRLSLTSSPAKATYTLTQADGDGGQIATGKTPDTIRELKAPKRYKLTLESKGYKPFEQVLEPSDGEPLALNPTLEREAAATVAAAGRVPRKEAQQVVKDEPAPKADPPKVVKTPPPPEPKGVATITVASKPVARVFIDGKDTGKYTPLINHKLPAAKHKIELVNEEFNLRKTYYLDLKAGEFKKLVNRP